MNTDAVTPAVATHRSILEFHEKRRFNWLVLGLLILTAIIFLLTAVPDLVF